MAGDSGLFEVGGARYPKNLVEIDGEPLVQRVIDGLQPLIEAADQSIFMIREEEQRRHHTGDVIRLLLPDADVIAVPTLQSGAACTALHAIGHIVRDESLLVVNGDQVVEADLAGIVADFERRGHDAGVVTFERCTRAGHTSAPAPTAWWSRPPRSGRSAGWPPPACTGSPEAVSSSTVPCP